LVKKCLEMFAEIAERHLLHHGRERCGRVVLSLPGGSPQEGS
jgi:hypothetical protein